MKPIHKALKELMNQQNTSGVHSVLGDSLYGAYLDDDDYHMAIIRNRDFSTDFCVMRRMMTRGSLQLTDMVREQS